MATARKVAALIKELETEEQWEELMQLSEKKLISAWQGSLLAQVTPARVRASQRPADPVRPRDRQ